MTRGEWATINVGIIGGIAVLYLIKVFDVLPL